MTGALGRSARCLAVALTGLLAMGAAEPLAPADAAALADAVEVTRSGDPARARECAARLEELAGRLGDADPRGAEVLTHAAQCHEAAGEYDAMVAARERLVERFPATPAARVALLALVRHHRATLAFERAAAAMERFGERWPAEKEALELLQEAALLRAQMGDEARALALFERVEQLAAARDPQRAAIIFWARADLLPGTLPDDQARRAHAQAYVERHGVKGGPARRIVAEVEIAAIDWRRSCRQKDGLMDLCVTSRPAAIDAPGRGKPPKLTCAGPNARVVTVHPRDRKLADAAQARLREVVKLGRVLPPVDDPWLRARVNEALDLAELILADVALEASLELQVPTGLSFFVDEARRASDSARDRKIHAEQVRRREDSTRRFLAYWEKTRAQSQELDARYERIAAAKQSLRGGFAATARRVIVAQTQVDRLLAAELPDGLGSDAAIKAYCGALRDQTDPVEAFVTQGLEYCFDRAAMLAYTDPSVEFCAAELQRRLPREHPPQRELFGPMTPPALEATALPVQLEPPLDVE